MLKAPADSSAFGPARRSASPLPGVLTAAVLFALAPLPTAGSEIPAADTPTTVAAPATTAPTTPTLEITRGDEAWARRAEGQTAGRAAAAPIAEAVAAYEAALRAAPESLEAHWKLLRALWFQGDYATEGTEARKEGFARGRSVGDSAMASLAKGAGGKEKLAQPA